MMITHNIIAIDPDVSKSGVAYLEKESKKMEVASISFPQLLDYLRHAGSLVSDTNRLTVVVEAGWMVAKSNYHGNYGARGERIAKNVGSNHETGKKICEMLAHYGIDYQEVRPLKKCWKGRDGKITKEELDRLMLNANIPTLGRISQDARDAALLCLTYAGVPLRL